MIKIEINDRRKIYAVQEEFNKAFPYLKIEFFTKPHTQGGASPQKVMKHPSKTLGECRTVHDVGTITITPNTTVTNLEESFRDVYGLTVQVLRKSGKVWLETIATGGWTLEEQNKEGEFLSHELQKK